MARGSVGRYKMKAKPHGHQQMYCTESQREPFQRLGGRVYSGSRSIANPCFLELQYYIQSPQVARKVLPGGYLHLIILLAVWSTATRSVPQKPVETDGYHVHFYILSAYML